MTTLAADIGGTYSRFAWFADDVSASAAEQCYTNADFTGIEDIIEHGRRSIAADPGPITDMVLAVPGPVQRDPIELTNIDWRIQREALRARFGIRRLTIVNDFQAAALGAVNEPYEHLKALNPATPDDGPVVVTGAGTGLGMAWLADRDQQDLPHPTEGGHMDFAPNDAAQLALYHDLAAQFGHVSYERVLSGDGLVDTYRHVAGASAPAAGPADIATLAGRGDHHAGEAVRLFVEIFAGYAGNLALAFNPRGGIYLCGGLSAHLAKWFDPTAFSLAFTRRGRMADIVRRVPVYLVQRHGTGLAGAVHIARSRKRSPWA